MALASVAVVSPANNPQPTPTSFTASAAVQLVRDDVGPLYIVVDIANTGAGEGGSFEWYMEFSPDNSTWFREAAQENTASGTYAGPQVTRSFDWPGSGTTLRRTFQFAVVHDYVRVQYRKTSSAAPNGSTVVVIRGNDIAAA